MLTEIDRQMLLINLRKPGNKLKQKNVRCKDTLCNDSQKQAQSKNLKPSKQSFKTFKSQKRRQLT